MTKRIALSSRKMGNIPHLPSVLEGELIKPQFFHFDSAATHAAGWGYTHQSLRLQKFSQRHEIPFTFVEDGFLRSVGLGKTGTPALSLICDPKGLYYDSGKPCLLDDLIRKAEKNDIRAMFNALRLTKYNLEPDRPINLQKTAREIVLIIDQVKGDRSIEQAGANEQTFFDMVTQARAMHPLAMIYLKVHPDVKAGLAKGILAEKTNLPHIVEAVSPHALLDVVDHVHTVSSQFGFEALLRGVPVTTYAKPFYMKTDDIDKLATAAIALYPTYFDPVFGDRLTAHQGLERLARWRDQSQSLLKTYSGYGFSRWKQGYVRRFLKGHGAEIDFRSGNSPLKWGMKPAPDKAVTMEDGFIRSRGLGSNFVAPISLILDQSGIYFDATKPSDFENLVEKTIFTPELLRRAEKIKATIIENNISKYNLDYNAQIPHTPYRLVIGQVEDDASIRFGTFEINTNAKLLAKTRAAYPLDLLVYKEHPDVSAGNRKGALSKKEAELADIIITNGDVTPWLTRAASLHTMTSLAGFEALLRGIPVYCEGLPFYAGYGLTIDSLNCPRRKYVLTLHQLIAITLIIYPRYTDPLTGIPLEVEEAIRVIIELPVKNDLKTIELPYLILKSFK